MTTLKVKISREDKALFVSIAESLGLTPSDAVRIFIKKFNEERGFPFAVKQKYRINYDDPGVLRARVENGQLLVPAAWRDADEDDDEE